MTNSKSLIIGVGNQKGGVGKSTIAFSLAGGFVNRFPGAKVILVNADKNSSVTQWADSRDMLNQEREEKGLKPLPHIDSVWLPRENYINRQLNSLREKYDFIICDTGGHDNNAFHSVLLTADVIYAPLQPTQFDLNELKPTLEQIEKYEMLSEDKKIDVRLILSKIESTSPARIREANEFCKGMLHIASISSVAIKKAAIFLDCASSGESPHDLRNKHRASIDLLIDEILGDRQVAFMRKELPHG